MSQVLTFKLEAPNLAKDRVSILPNYLSFLFTVSLALVACSCSKGKPRAKVFARSTSSDSRFKPVRIFRQWYLKSPFVLHYIEKYLFICHRFISEPTRTDKSFGFRLWLGFRLGTWTGYLGLYLQSVYFGGSSFWGLVLDRQRVAKTPSSSLSSRVYLPRMWRSNSSKRLLLLKSLSWEIVVSSSKWPFDSRYRGFKACLTP